MLDIVSIMCLPLTVIVLTALAIIDLRTLLLPNILVLIFAMLGGLFHVSTLYYYGDIITFGLGSFIGGASLYVVRFIGNAYYKTDTLGLGDVKLMAAGGLWLGMHDIMMAIAAGAVCGLVHGILLLAHGRIKTGTFPKLSTFSLPAGPGFIAGLVIVGVAKFWGLPHLSF